MCLEEKKNETVCLYPTFLTQEINNDKNDNKYNNTNKRLIKKKGESKTNRRSKMKKRKIIKIILKE